MLYSEYFVFRSIVLLFFCSLMCTLTSAAVKYFGPISFAVSESFAHFM